MKTTRTEKDKREYAAVLRREHPIMTEVIVELRERNKELLRSQARLLAGLIAAQDALRIYRVANFEMVQRALNQHGHCVPGCTRHRWDDEDGWHRIDAPTEPSRMIAHHYLSTACFHEVHGDCRRTCKFCEAGCSCPCHDAVRR